MDDDRIGFVIADVSGKGVPAAFFMAVARTLLRSVAMGGTGPAESFAYVNRMLCEHHIPGMFVTVVYGTLNASTGEICYANVHACLFRRLVGVHDKQTTSGFSGDSQGNVRLK